MVLFVIELCEQLNAKNLIDEEKECCLNLALTILWHHIDSIK